MLLRLFTLGQCRAVVGERVIRPSRELVFAALLVLGLEPRREFGRGELCEMLWPDADERTRAGRLRWLLSQLRKLGLPLEAGDTHVSLRHATIETDFSRVEGGMYDAIGSVLPDYRPSFSQPFARWVDSVRDRIGLDVVRQLAPRLNAAKQADDWQGAVNIAAAIKRIDPLNEEAALTSAEAHCRLGARAQGLAVLDDYLGRLGHEHPELHLSARLMRRRVEQAVEASAPSGEPAFVGREDVLKRIDAMLRDSVEGRGAALAVTGPAGIGKTRILGEAAGRAVMMGMQLIYVRCQPGPDARPLGGLVNLIPQLLNLRGAAGATPEHYARLRRLLTVDGDDDEEQREVASPALLRTLLGAAVVDVLDAASSESPVFIQIDDVQWAHESLDWFWEPFIASCAQQAVALLFAWRTSVGRTPTLTVPALPIHSLDSRAAACLLDELAARLERRLDDEVRTALVSRGAGNPLFLREVIRQWAATGRAESMPASLTSLIDLGLDHIGTNALRALQVAATLGSYATLDRMERLLQLPRAALIDAVAELETAAMLRADARGSTKGHVLWAEGASARLSDGLRSLLHRSAADVLEAELADRTDVELLWECVRHWTEACEPDRARDAMMRGAEHLARHGFPDEAVAAYDRLAALTAEPAELLPLLRRKIELLNWAGRSKLAIAAIDAHERIASEADPLYDRHNELEMMRARAVWAESRDMGSSAEALLRCARDARATTAHRLSALEQWSRTVEFLPQSAVANGYAALAELSPRSAEEQWSDDCIRTYCELRVGDPRVALNIAERALANCRARSNSLNLLRALHMYATCLHTVGRLADARAAFQEGARTAALCGVIRSEAVAHDRLIGIALDFENVDLARRALQGARRPMTELGMRGLFTSSAIVMNNAEAQLAILEGRHADALSLLAPVEDWAKLTLIGWQVRFLSMHLAARLEQHDETLHAVAGWLEERLADFSSRVDWPVSRFLMYVDRWRGRDAARTYAQRYVYELRRELFPPPLSIQQLCGAPWSVDQSPVLSGRGASSARLPGSGVSMHV